MTLPCDLTRIIHEPGTTMNHSNPF
jgi:hypothetical protein